MSTSEDRLRIGVGDEVVFRGYVTGIDDDGVEVSAGTWSYLSFHIDDPEGVVSIKRVGGEPEPLEPLDTESYCHRCGGPNVSWCAPSPLWNAVMRPNGNDSPWLWDEIICPTCFAVLAQEAGIAFLWRLYATDADVPQVSPSGRRWNPETWLWDDEVAAPNGSDAPGGDAVVSASPVDPYTLATRLCDDNGMVSHEKVPDLPTPGYGPTYLEQFNFMRSSRSYGPPPVVEPFACTGSAHVAGEHIRCTSPAHKGVTMWSIPNGSDDPVSGAASSAGS